MKIAENSIDTFEIGVRCGGTVMGTMGCRKKMLSAGYIIDMKGI